MALRLLHTADWHLGASLHGHDRFDEHAAFLAWLLDQLEEHAVDALIVAGDVLDKTVSPASAYQQLYDFLRDALARCPSLDVVLVAGNHDPASRLEAPASLMRQLSRVHVVGTYDEDDVERLIVPLHDQSGQVAAQVVAMPFLRSGDRRSEESTAACLKRVYDDAFARARTSLQPSRALIGVGHCHLVGGRISNDSERGLLRGGEEGVPVSIFPDDVAYVALGHLHLAQAVGDARIRYSGSPIPLAMSERTYEHSVTLVDLEGSRARSIHQLPVPRAVSMVSISATLEELPAALRVLPPRGSERAPFVELLLTVEGPTPSLRREVETLLEPYAARVVRVRPTAPMVTPGEANPASEARREGPTPADVFERLHSQRFGACPSDDLRRAFDSLVEEVRDAEVGASVELAKELSR
ncbi:MAG: exonuclease SbcCD subunit D C-terminal domain-containing protein [Sandaracinus sp.]|nr:exonuclease SbcCD subunit D C-terminal domain-containing protein [Sandaracinus sp.]